MKTLKSQNKRVWMIVLSGIVIMGLLLGLGLLADYRREIHLVEERLMAQAQVIDENLSANLYSVSLIHKNIIQELGEILPNQSNRLNNYLKIQSDLILELRLILCF